MFGKGDPRKGLNEIEGGEEGGGVAGEGKEREEWKEMGDPW